MVEGHLHKFEKLYVGPSKGDGSLQEKHFVCTHPGCKVTAPVDEKTKGADVKQASDGSGETPAAE